MWSKQEKDKYFNGIAQQRKTKSIKGDIESFSVLSKGVSVKSVRGQNHSKYLSIKINDKNVYWLNELRLNLNEVKRLNFKNGTQEMFRYVNGLCQKCGHDHYRGDVRVGINGGFTLSNLVCSKCNKKQEWDWAETNTGVRQNKGKKYADNQKKRNIGNKKKAK